MRPLLVLVLALAACSAKPEPPKPVGPPPVRIGELDGKPLMLAHGAVTATLADGTPVLQRSGAGWSPLPMVAGARIVLDDGSMWAQVRFTDGDAPAQPRWVAPAHSREEVARRLANLTEETARLPETLAARVKPLLPVMALVSATEGDFGDPATHTGDRAASLGIFQWAADRDALHVAGSSLSRFFVGLKKRALAKTDPLFVRAWKSCTRRGFDVRAGDFRLKKKPATPAQVVTELRGLFGEGALRSYQLVAAADWIDEVRNAVVRPGHRGGELLGHGYAEAEAGRMVRFTVDGKALRLRAREVVTVGQLLRGPEQLATAVSLGVNRPHYVETALWQVLSPADASAQVTTLLAAHQEDQLQALLWPRAAQADEAELMRSFRERALELYRPGDRERRARRLITALLLR